MHAAGRVAVRHLLVQDAPAGRHPLHVAGAQGTVVAQAVGMVDRAGEHVGDGLDPAMRVPGEAGLVVGGTIVAEIVEQQERVVLARVAEPEGAAQPDAGTLHRRAGLDDALHRADGHAYAPAGRLLREAMCALPSATSRHAAGRRPHAGPRGVSPS